VSDAVIGSIIAAVQKMKPISLIEVGPGAGALTELLEKLQVPLQLIELDSVFAKYWSSRGLPVVEADALQLNWRPYTQTPCVLVSNLPYQISSSLVIERSIQQDVIGMVLMFQKEVAQRLRARPSDEDFGMLSVFAQTYWKIEIVCEAGPRDFSPAPRVASRVLSFEPRWTEGSVKPNAKKFLSFVKMAFVQRRKLLKKNLAGWVNGISDGNKILIDKIAEFGLKETARAEELSPAQFVELYEHLDRSREQKSKI
jgi:16S rRNA (adenine1518-N6/adenine1519-N6)-dimethyltransferase